MSNSSYDDGGWNFIASPESSKHINTQLYSTVFFVSFIALTLLGLAFIYSATYPIAEDLGVGDFEFLVRQLIYIAIGIVIGVVLFVLPQKVIAGASYLLLFGGIVVLAINVIALNSYVLSEVSLQLIILVSIVFFANFFSKKQNSIGRLRDLSIPVVVVLALVFLILFEKNITFACLAFVVAVIMFACGGVGFGGVLLLLLFAIIPTVCTIFSNAKTVQMLLDFFVPGLENSRSFADQSFVRLQAICSGGVFGKGLGLGQFKFGTVDKIYSTFIFCDICEEIGFFGASIIVLLFGCFAFCGYKCASSLRYSNLFASNLLTGLVSHVLICFFVNIFSCFNIVPTDSICLPFVSYDASVICFILESVLIYKFSKIDGDEE